jgi:hypothetical protein
MTKTLQISSNREELELNKDNSIIEVNALQTAAYLARKGQIKRAQVLAKSIQKNMVNSVRQNPNPNNMLNLYSYEQNMKDLYGHL